MAVGIGGHLLSVNAKANLLFDLTLDDWNRPFKELEVGTFLGAHISAPIQGNRHPLTLKNIKRVTADDTQYFDVAIAPIFNVRGRFFGITLALLDVTDCQQLNETLQRTRSDLAEASKSLQATEESQLSVAKMDLAAAHQEIQLLSQNSYDSK